MDREEYIKEARAKFNSYNTSSWKRVYFDEHSGGYNVYHKEHKFTKIGGGGEAEMFVGIMLAKNCGKQIEFLPEGKKKGPDVKFDEQTWDIKSISRANENTIRKYILDARKADNAIFYWNENNKLADLKNAMNREAGRLLKGQICRLPDIYYIDRDRFLKLLWEKQKETK